MSRSPSTKACAPQCKIPSQTLTDCNSISLPGKMATSPWSANPHQAPDGEHLDKDFEQSVHLTFAFGSDLKRFSDRVIHVRIIGDANNEEFSDLSAEVDSGLSYPWGSVQQNPEDGRGKQKLEVDLEMQPTGEGPG